VHGGLAKEITARKIDFVTLRDMQFYRIRRMMIDDSATKNTRLLDREFISKTEHLELQILVHQICDDSH